MNMSRSETLATRFGEMGDLIACMQIRNGAEQKSTTKKRYEDIVRIK